MADEQSTIIELTIDLDKALKDTTDYKIRVDELKRALDLLKNSQESTGEEIAKANAEYQSANEQLRSNEKVLKQLTTAQNEEAGTLEKLTARNAQLRAERQKLNLTTEDGQKRVKEINAELDKNNTTIRENSDAAKKQALNIGNYGSALDGVTDKLSAIPGPAGGVISSFTGMTKAAWAFVATPIGAIIAAIVLAVTTLISVFKQFDPVIDRIQQGMAALSAIMTALKEGALALFTGQKSLSDSFKELGGSMSKAAKEAIALKKAEQELDDMNWLLIESNAKSKRQIDELLLQSKDRTKSEEERIALIDKALKIEEEAYANRKAIADREYELALGKITTGRNLTDEQIKQLKEVGVQAAINLKDTKSVTDEEVKAFADAIAKREQTLNESIAIREKAINRQNALIEKGEEEQTKINEAAAAAREKAEAERIKRAEKAAADEVKRLEAEAAAKQKAAEDAVAALEYELKQFEATNSGKYESAKFLTQSLVDEEKARQQQVYDLEKGIIEKRFSDGLSSKMEYDTALLDLDIAAKEQQRAVDQEWADIKLQDQITAEQMRFDAEMVLAQDSIFARLELERGANEQRKIAELALIDELAINEEQKLKLRQKITQKYAKADIAINKATTNAKMALAGGFAENIATIAGEQTSIGKAAAVAATTISTFQGATAAFTGMTSTIPGPVGIGLGIAAAAAAVVSGLANVKKILAVKSGLPGDSGGGGSVPSAGTPMAMPAALPTGASPTIGQGIVSRDTIDTTGQMKSAFSEALSEAPMRTAVVTDEVTAAQNIASNNQISATI